MSVISTNPSAVAARRDAYDASLRGRRFIATNLINTPIALPTALLATTPTLMLRLSGASRRVVFRSIIISLTSVGGGDQLRTIVVPDTTDRWVSGGTLHPPYSMNEESSVASAVTGFYSNPTASAAGAGVRLGTHMASLNSVGLPFGINYGDGFILGKTSSLLFYVFTTTTPAANAFFTAEWDEVE